MSLRRCFFASIVACHSKRLIGLTWSSKAQGSPGTIEGSVSPGASLRDAIERLVARSFESLGDV